MRIRFTPSSVLRLLACVSLAVLSLGTASWARAATTTLTGAVTPQSPTFVRPGNFTQPFVAGTESFRYFTQTITPSVTGNYDLLVTATTGGDTDSVLFLYGPTFDPAAPLSNAMLADDDSGAGYYSLIAGAPLTGGQTYVIVATFYGTSSNGTITFDITGPGSVAISGGPVVTGVTAATPDGTYAGGAAISIQVTFDAAVTVTGTPTLALSTAPSRTALYTSGSGTNTLTFTYLVQPGDTAADLDYASTTALTATGGASIANAVGTAATLTLPAPGAVGSLGHAKAIALNSISSPPAPYAWGAGWSGQVGHGVSTVTDVKSPVAVITSGALHGKTVTGAAMGRDHTVAVTSDGRVFAWGNNWQGTLGNNTQTSSNTPVPVDESGVLNGKTITAVAAGSNHSLALDSTGRVYAWGGNYSGALGNNATVNSLVPVAVDVSGALSGKTITAISAGTYHSLALDSTGRVYGWGDNYTGALGNNSTKGSKTPVAVDVSGALAGKTIIAISAGANFSLALDSTGRVYGWGTNYAGNLGNNTTANSLVPVAVDVSGVLSGKTITRIAAGANHALALDSSGRVYAWGENYMGLLGNNSTLRSTVPVAVHVSGALSGKTVTEIAAGSRHSTVLTSEGRIYAWGDNMYGQLGDGKGGRYRLLYDYDNYGLPMLGGLSYSTVPTAVDTSGVLGGTSVTNIASGSTSLHTVALAATPSAPVVSSVTVPAAGIYGAGQALTFTVTFSNPVTVTGTPGVPVTIGSTSRSATYLSGGGTASLVFRYTIQPGETDADGIVLGSEIALNGGTLAGTGGSATRTLVAPDTSSVFVDTAPPAVASIVRKSPAAASVTATSVGFRVSFTRSVTGVDASDFTLTGTGSANGTISSVTAAGSVGYDVVVDAIPPSASGTLRLDVRASGTGIVDIAGNALSGGYSSGQTYTIVPPVLQPRLTSATYAIATYGSPFAYAITAGHDPVGFSAAGLPTGLSVDPATGLISGTPTQAGKFFVTLSATNAGGTGHGSLSLYVAPAALTVTAVDATRAFGASNPPFAVSYSGFVNGDTAASLATAPSVATAASPDSSVGTYTLKVGGGRSENYTFSYVPGTLSVTTTPVAITLGTLSQTYSGQPLGPTVRTVPENVSVNLTYNGSTTAPTAAGTYTVAATVTNANYTGTAQETLTISPASQAITIGALPGTIPLKDFGGPIQITATATSGLPVVLTLDAGSAATLNSSDQIESVANTGTITLRANQPGDANTLPAEEVVLTLDVVKSNQALAFTAPNNATFGDAPITLVATADSSLTPVFTVVSGPATVSGSTLTLTGAGPVVIRASQPGDGAYNPAPSIVHVFTVFKGNQGIDFPEPAAPTYGDAPVALSATASSGLPVTYTVISGPATLSGATLALTGAGEVIVRASQVGDANTDPAPDFERTIKVARKALTATAQDASRIYGESNPVFTTAYTGFVGADSDSDLATLPQASTTADAESVPGTYAITLSGGEAANYDLTPVDGTLTITKAAQTLSFIAPQDCVYGADPVALVAATSAGLVPTFAVDSGPASVSDSTLTLTGAGSITVTASQAGNALYLASNTVTRTFTVTPKTITVTGINGVDRPYDGTNTATLDFTHAALDGVINGDSVTLETGAAAATFADAAVGTAKPVTITGLALSGPAAAKYLLMQPSASASISKANAALALSALAQTYDGSPRSVLAVTSPAHLSVLLTYAGSPTAPSAAGSYAVSATIVDDSYQGTATGTLVVAKASATVSLTGLSRTYDGSPQSVSAAVSPAHLSVDITYNGSASAPADAGSYAVIASVVDDNYTGAANGTLVIAKADQTITFAPIGSLTIDAPVTLSATASSGLPVTFSAVSGGISVVGNTLTASAATDAVVRASQSGSANYNAANVDQVISGAEVTRLAQTISFTAIADKSVGDGPFALQATASSGLDVVLTVQSGPASLSGTTLTLSGAPGSVTVVASQSGNATYAAASSVTRTFAVTAPAPLTYFGTLTDGTEAQGDLAAHVAADGTGGILIGYIPGQAGGFIVNFTPDAHGAFVATVTPLLKQTGINSEVRDPLLAAAAVGWTFRGRLIGDTITGTIDELALDFGAVADPITGPTATMAGYYTSASLDTTTGSIYSIVGTTGEVYVLAVTPDLVGGAASTLDDSTGDFSVSLGDGVMIDGNVDTPTTTIDAAIIQSSGATRDFSGVRSGTTRTDRLINLSSRARVGSGDEVVITGFVIGGDASKRVLLRAVGPGLEAFHVAGALRNPRMTLFRAGVALAQNDDWSSGGNSDELIAAAELTGAFGLAAGSRDAALLVTLEPGAYTVIMDGAGEHGVALAEVYDASVHSTPHYQRMINISTRGYVGTGDDTLIGGFVVNGNAPKRVLVRGIGPQLAAFGVTGVLANPELSVHRGSALLAQNSDWGSGANSAAELAAAAASTGAFALDAGSKDAAVLITLAPGAYTVHVSGAAGTTGIALVEVYEVPAN